MADFFDHITDKIAAFIAEQPMFFVATATADSRINLSPKGMDSFRVLGPNHVAYLDLTGSGNETAAHLQHDGRITVMFNSFTRNPLILRLYGRGRNVTPNDADWAEISAPFPEMPGARQIISVDVEAAQTSCGFGVPVMDLVGERDTLVKWAEKKGADGVAAYQRQNNRVSIDGLEIG